MSIIAKVPSNSYKIPNEGCHTGTLTNVEDKGWQPNPFQKDQDGQPRLRHQVLLEWQLEDDSKVKEFQTLSLHEKANLTKVVRALTGTTPSGNDEMDLTNLIGESCRLEIEHRRARDGKVWPRVVGHFALPKNGDSGSTENDAPEGFGG